MTALYERILEDLRGQQQKLAAEAAQVDAAIAAITTLARTGAPLPVVRPTRRSLRPSAKRAGKRTDGRTDGRTEQGSRHDDGAQEPP